MNESATEFSHQHDPERQHYNVTLAVLAVAGVSYALLQSAVAPALTDIGRVYNASESSVSWVLTGYLLSAAVATPILGRLGDRFGKERLLMITLAILAAGTLGAALAPSIGFLVAMRVVQGVGGGIFPLAFGIIRDEFPRERVAGAIGLVSALLGIGAGFGVVGAGVIVDNFSFHYLFWVPLPFIVGAALATWAFIPESPVRAEGGINWNGAALMSGGIVAVLLAITEGSDWGWGSPKTLGLFVVGAALIAAWVFSELRSKSPLVDMKMMEIKAVWTTNVVGFLLGVGMYSSFLLLPQLVQLPKSTGFGFGVDVTRAGIYLLPSALAMLVAGSRAGRLEARFGSKPPLIAGSFFTGLSFLLLGFAHSQPWELYLASALMGIGIGLAFAAMSNLIVENVRPDQTGVATGMNTVMRSLGGAVGGQVVASILTAHVAGGLPAEEGFTVAFFFCAAAIGIGTLTGFLIPGRQAAPGAAAAHARTVEA